MSDPVDERIKELVSAAVLESPSPPPFREIEEGLAAEEARPPRAAARQPRRWRVAVAAAALVAIALTVATVGLLARDDGDEPRVVTGPADENPTGWSSIDVAEAFGPDFADGIESGSSRIDAIVAGGSGYVAAGTTNNELSIWTSEDASTWDQVDPATLPLQEGDFPVRLVRSGPRLVLIGQTSIPDSEWQQGQPWSGHEEWFVWTSEDGRTWQEAARPLETLEPGTPLAEELESGNPSAQRAANIYDLAGSDAGLVVLPAATKNEVLTSADGTTWERHRFTESGIAWDVEAVEGGGFVAIGEELVVVDPADPPQGRRMSAEQWESVGALMRYSFPDPGEAEMIELRPRVWSSADGTEWTALSVDGLGAGLADGPSSVTYDVTANGSRLLARADAYHYPEDESSRGGSETRVWISDDGSRWEPATYPVGGSKFELWAAGGWWIVPGWMPTENPGPGGTYTDTVVWATRDGEQWLPEPDQRSLFGSCQLLDAPTDGPAGILFLGSGAHSGACHGSSQELFLWDPNVE